MSYIKFETETHSAQVRGAEDANVRIHINTMSTAPLVDRVRHDERFLALFGAGHYVLTARDKAMAVESALSSNISPLYYCGKKVWPWNVAMNTAIDFGSEPVRLAARLSAQAIHHCYVEKPHRYWLADVLADGQKIGLFRDNMGWESVIALLEGDTPGPVVVSHSTYEPFLSPHTCGEDQDEWQRLPRPSQWEACIAGVRENKEDLELSPFNLEYRFGTTDNIHQIINAFGESSL